MKLKGTQSKTESGSVLAVTMVVTFVIGATLVSFLLLTQHQTFGNARSQSWNHTMAVTEAGVEDALQMINKYSDDPTKILDWTSDINAGGSAADSWVSLGNNTYKATRTIGDPVRARYEVFVDNSRPNAPTIRAEGRLTYEFEYAHSSGGVASAGTTSSRFKATELDRTVLVHTVRDALWTTAMLADVSIDFKGNNISTDSFNSADPAVSYWAPGATFGMYDASLSLDNGDVACNSSIINSLNVGNADIMGYVSTGPGGTVDVGAGGSVGSEEWVSGGNTGAEPGYVSDDMNVRLEDVSLPLTTWLPLIDAGKMGVIIDGTTYRHVIDMSGDYKASTLQGSVYVAPGVDARVYITDSVSLSGKDEIRISPDAQRLTVYMGGSQFKLGGSGVANETGNAGSFLYFGLPTNTDIVLGGNGGFTGAIYANHADFTMGGGGSDTQDFIGSCVTRTVRMNGHFNFHYDENLATIGPSRGFVPTTWEEL